MKIIGLVLMMIFVNCCKPFKENFYSYRTATYTVDSVKKLLYYHDLISYGDYLFEFKIKINVMREIHEGASDSTTIRYDTIGVYLLSGIDNQFYEFDTFALMNRVIKTGRMGDKPSGQHFSFGRNTSSDNLSYTPPKKVIINNILCFITTVITDKITEDSVRQQVLLINDPKFNSFYKMNGIKFIDSNYCIVGFQVYDLKKNEGLSEEIVAMRTLKESERKICENMIKLSKPAIIDTANLIK